MSTVTAVPAAAPADAIAHFKRRLSIETDCADVHAAIASGEQDFVLLHVVGSDTAFACRHVPGAIHLPHRIIDERALSRWPAGTLFVVYCAGPHCNGADQAALKLAMLGRPVKTMPGGMTGWADEGFAFAGNGGEPLACDC